MMIILRLLAGGTAESSNCWSDNRAGGARGVDAVSRLKMILWITPPIA